MKKPYILSLFVLAGFVLNFAFTVTPIKTEAVFGGPDNTDSLIQNQGNGSSFISDSLSPESEGAEDVVGTSSITDDAFWVIL